MSRLNRYLRNGCGATTARSWLARARPALGVSVPIAWDEVAKISGGAHWAVQNIHSSLDKGNEPWKGYEAQGIAKAMKLLDFAPSSHA
jgi:bifunctional non-homologous end joining protein LigD